MYSASHQARAAPNVFTSVASGPWSDAHTWDKGVPQTGGFVEVSSGNTVTYDLASSPRLGNITVDGSLEFNPGTPTGIAFSNMTIDPMGYVSVGTDTSPIPAGVTATLQLAANSEGHSGIFVMGMLDIHGASIGRTWVKLGASANSGVTSVTLSQAMSWNKGDHIVITSSSLLRTETEENYIASITGNKITLVQPLKYSHDGVAPAQAEVADLTRNVVVTSLNPAVHAMGVMFMNAQIMGMMGMGAPMGLSGVSYAEFSHLGGKGILGNYPIHFHHTHQSEVGTVINGISVWDSHNRFLTLHDSDGITVANSVGYKAIGHGFFMEDGNEMNNSFLNDIAILTLPGHLRPDDGAAAGFWIQNTVNSFSGDTAVSAAGNGFDFDVNHMTPDVIPFNQQNFDLSKGRQLNVRTLPLTLFKDNEAHSNSDGVFLYNQGRTKPTTIRWFTGTLAWRNQGVGFDISAADANVTAMTAFGNRQGNIRLAQSDNTLAQANVMGELPGVLAGYSTDSGNLRYRVSPIGLMAETSRVYVTDSHFSGHEAKGSAAYADIINTNDGRVTDYISNTHLQSKHQILLGYPLNGDSWIVVRGLNGDSTQNFVLFRYDVTPDMFQYDPPKQTYTGHLGTCQVSLSYMADQCALLS